MEMASQRLQSKLPIDMINDIVGSSVGGYSGPLQAIAALTSNRDMPRWNFVVGILESRSEVGDFVGCEEGRNGKYWLI